MSKQLIALKEILFIDGKYKITYILKSTQKTDSIFIPYNKIIIAQTNTPYFKKYDDNEVRQLAQKIQLIINKKNGQINCEIDADNNLYLTIKEPEPKIDNKPYININNIKENNTEKNTSKTNQIKQVSSVSQGTTNIPNLNVPTNITGQKTQDISPSEKSEAILNMRIMLLSVLYSFPKFKISASLYKKYLETNDINILEIDNIKTSVIFYLHTFVRNNLLGLYKNYANLINQKIDHSIYNLYITMSPEKQKMLQEKFQLSILDITNNKTIEQPEKGKNTIKNNYLEAEVQRQTGMTIGSLFKTPFIEQESLFLDDKKNNEDAIIEFIQFNTLLNSICISQIAIPMLQPFFNDKIINEAQEVLQDIQNLNNNLINNEIIKKWESEPPVLT